MKTRKMLQKIVALAAVVTLLASMFTGTLWASAEDEVLLTIFDEEALSDVRTSSANVSTPGLDSTQKKVGNNSWRAKLGYATPNAFDWVKMVGPSVYNATQNRDNTALQFWYNPLLERPDMQVGLVAEQSGSYETLRVPFADFLQAAGIEMSYDGNSTEWHLITIPFSYLETYGAYYDGTEQAGDKAAFNWARVQGIFFGASTDPSYTWQPNWFRVDAVQIVTSDLVVEPEPPDPDTMTPEAKGTVIQQLYDKTGPVSGVSQGRYGDSAFSVGADNLNTHFTTEQAPNADPEITRIARLKVGSSTTVDGEPKTGMAAGDRLYFSWCNWGKGLDTTRDWVNTAAVEFWINPMTNKPDGLYAGVCSTEGEKGDQFPNVVVDLHDVISLTDADYGDWKWQKVVLPLSYLKEHGTYCDGGSGLDAFNWANVSGMTILAVASDEAHAISGEVNWIRLSDAKLITYIAPPTSLEAVPGDGSVSLSWTASSSQGVTGYNIFRDGVYLTTVNTTNYTDNDVTNNVQYTYQVQAASADTASSSASVQATPTDGSVVTPPTVSITAPEDGAAFKVGDSITITADAADSDGSIAKVEFFDGENKLGEATQAPYEYVWAGAAAGAHSLTAKATDNDNASTTSEAVSIGVYNAPTVTLTEPADGTKYVSGTGFYLLAKATADTTANPENEVTIQYYRNGQPTNTSKQTVGDGEYTYYAVATDSNGLSTQSEPVTVTVGEGGNVIREFYKENLRNGILRLQTSNITYRSADQNAQPNPAGEGPIPIQIEAKDTNSLMFRVYDNANLLQKENAPFKDIGALTFSIYLDNEGDQSYLDGWNIALMSHAASGNDLVYSYLPLKNYLNGQSVFKQWVDVSIPFTDFENGTFYSGTGDAITPAEGTAFNWDWLFGAGFICTPTAAGEKFYLNDVQFQTKDGGDTPDPQPDYELDEVAFSADSLAAAKDTGSVTATVKLTNNTNAPLPVSAVVAVFEGDKLAGVKIAPVSSAAAEQQTEITTPAVSVSAEATSVRVFVWNGLGAMAPYGGNAATLE